MGAALRIYYVRLGNQNPDEYTLQGQLRIAFRPKKLDHAEFIIATDQNTDTLTSSLTLEGYWADAVEFIQLRAATVEHDRRFESAKSYVEDVLRRWVGHVDF